MAAGKFGPKDITLTLEDAPGGTARALRVINSLALKIVSRMMNTTALGDDFDKSTPTGSRAVEPIPIKAVYDTTATTGAAPVLEIKAADADPQSAGRQLVATINGSGGQTFTVTGHLGEYQVSAQPGTDLVVIDSVFQPDGAGVWATIA
jgi:hypothetical protein